MNRRTFINATLSTAFTLSGIALGRGSMQQGWFSGDPNLGDIKDLVIWAPYEPFSPDDTHPTVDDPSDGTQTGVLKADDILKGVDLTLPYWHGHNGILHMFTVTAANFASLKAGQPVVIYVPTTVVDDHFHLSIIDPNRPA